MLNIPARAGIGLRALHFDDVLKQLPDVAWFEAHSENYFGFKESGFKESGFKESSFDKSGIIEGGFNNDMPAGIPLHYLEKVRGHYPVSLHGVGLSLGSTDPLNKPHLKKLKQLIHRIEPGLVSEHLSWSSVDGQYFNDLLPLPYTEESLTHMVSRVSETQDLLGRQILIENASSYLEFTSSTIPEWEFVTALAQQSGCKLLLDVNNIYVNAMNHGFDPLLFVHSVPAEMVGEIHLAGHTVKTFDEGVLLIDTHDQRVCDAVWALYDDTVAHVGDVPALIEWDSHLPALAVLVEEAKRADAIAGERIERIA
ncbi:MAG: DUF692 domain-containing protein [Ectothiorhodospiraceae bacterium]|nr:DUF692 domain-containing protein [Ectothiorhodospiraceae bacterium]